MKTEDINKLAAEVMQKHKVDEVYATKDGNVFLPKDKSAAAFHAKNTKQTVITIKRADVINEESDSEKKIGEKKISSDSKKNQEKNGNNETKITE
jgi:hypothetical protein